MGCSGALAADSELGGWAEIGGEVEVGVFGVSGRSEAIRGEGIGVFSSARTNVGAGYLQMTQVFAIGSAVPVNRFDLRAKRVPWVALVYEGLG